MGIYRSCLRFLRISDKTRPKTPIEVYRCNRVVLGVNCSPFPLNAVFRYHLNSNAEEIPDFAAKMYNRFCVDNVVAGGIDAESGI